MLEKKMDWTISSQVSFYEKGSTTKVNASALKKQESYNINI